MMTLKNTKNKLRFAAIFIAASGVMTHAGQAQTLPDPIQDAQYFDIDMGEVFLGQFLFYDPLISGNKNISCATCHHPRFFTSDGLSLGIGEGGIGLGPDRKTDPNNAPEHRIPRNAPALFNLGALEFTTLFHDGRIEADLNRPSGIRTPLDDDMLIGFDNILSAQTMFPVLSADEMAGHYSENDVSQAVRQGRLTGEGGAWDIIAKRVANIPAYQQQFEAVNREISAGRAVAFTDISNVIAAFIAHEWRSDDSPFDQMLRGEMMLETNAQAGQELFYGDANCATCHSGPFQTDHKFHAMGVPQIGPGKAASFENHARDEGRIRVTGRAEDAYAFRTPSLRNVIETGPFGHDGAYGSLTAFLRSHSSPSTTFESYNRNGAVLTELPEIEDWQSLDNANDRAAISQAALDLNVDLTDDDIALLIAFLRSLSDEIALSGRLGIPVTLPSGLPIDR